jgi:hypothetical protein
MCKLRILRRLELQQEARATQSCLLLRRIRFDLSNDL